MFIHRYVKRNKEKQYKQVNKQSLLFENALDIA